MVVWWCCISGECPAGSHRKMQIRFLKTKRNKTSPTETTPKVKRKILIIANQPQKAKLKINQLQINYIQMDKAETERYWSSGWVCFAFLSPVTVDTTRTLASDEFIMIKEVITWHNKWIINDRAQSRKHLLSQVVGERLSTLCCQEGWGVQLLVPVACSPEMRRENDPTLLG